MLHIPKELLEKPYKAKIRLDAKVIYAILLDKYCEIYKEYDKTKFLTIYSKDFIGYGLHRGNKYGDKDYISFGEYIRWQLEIIENVKLIKIEHPESPIKGVRRVEPLKIYLNRMEWIDELYKQKRCNKW
jgi:hypothetical protein